MSRVGKNPVQIPNGVTVVIDSGIVTAKGNLGELSATFTDEIAITQQENLIMVAPRDDTLKSRKMWGTARSVINNLVLGVSEGFTKNLQINGVGYRAQVEGKELSLQLGYSHDVKFPIPEGIEINCPEQTRIEIKGVDKQKVGQTAAVIRGYRPPEPYKAKGIRYDDEFILRKEGKKK